MIQRLIVSCTAFVTLVLSSTGETVAAPIVLINSDFEAAPILGLGQTGVALGGTKLIQTNPAVMPQYGSAISGILGWNYALPAGGTASDHGLARRNANFGLGTAGQLAFINNWNRMISQTIATPLIAGDLVTASIQVGTLGSDTDRGRAGRFYLVAGEANPLNPDQFSARSIILDEISVANPTWTGFTPDVTIGNRQMTTLYLSYMYSENDPALNLPLTVAFRTVTSSVGPTYWDNATLDVVHTPEPTSALGFSIVFAIGTMTCARSTRSRSE